MNRRIVIWLVVGALISSGIVFWRWENSRDEAIPLTTQDLHEHAMKLGLSAPNVSPPAAVDMRRSIRLAIGSLGFRQDEQNRRVSDLILAQLTAAKGLEMIERQSLDAVLREMHLSLSGLVRAQDAVHAGKLLKADWFLLGTETKISGTNLLVIRIVDARSGILRDAGVFLADKPPAQLSAEIAAFAQTSREMAANAKTRTYLAVGTFQDLSLNNRQAAFSSQLRSFLTAAYHGTEITLLEREAVDTLLQEARLDLAGLTENGGTNAPQPMQSAYWLVDGSYQSYETTNLQVELVLDISRMFGRRRSVSLREKPGEPMFQRVKESIDAAVASDQASLFPSRLTEMQAQLSAGKGLVQSVKDGMATYYFGSWLLYTGRMPATEVARHRRNAEEAIRALQTVLLLDAGNRDAKLMLGDCLGTPFIGQFDEGRELYREVVEVNASDELARQAFSKLRGSFWMESSVVRRQWFADAVERSTNSTAKSVFEQQLKVATEDVALSNRGTPEAERIAEERLFQAMDAWNASVRSHAYIVDFDNTGLGPYVRVFGTNSALAAQKLIALLPKLQAASSNLAPHIFAGVVSFQVDTNAPIIAEFEQMLDQFAERPPQTPELRYYVQLLGSPVYRWAERKRLYRLAAKLKEISLQMEMREHGVSSGEDDHLELAFNYTRAEEWQKALDIFQSYSNRPVRMGGSGIWGRAFTVVLPGKEADICRKKLGLPALKNSNEFEIGKSWMCLHEPNNEDRGEPAVFLTTTDVVWVASGNRLVRVGFDGQTNLIVRLPNDSAPITSLAMSDFNLWIGTAGNGLIEVDKLNSRCTRLSTEDGLMMDEIAVLQFVGNALWIGYGNGSRGGLGRMDVATRSITSFTPSLVEPAKVQPPGGSVNKMVCAPEGDVWFLTKGILGLHRPKSGNWEYFTRSYSVYVHSLVMDGTQIIEGLTIPLTTATIESRIEAGAQSNTAKRITKTFTYEEMAYFEQSLRTNRGASKIVARSGVSDLARGGLASRSLNDGRVRPLLEPTGLPHPPTAMALNARDLWVGGLGYLALVDVNENKILRIAYVPARSVEHIEVAGNFVWAQMDKHIYRVASKNSN